MFIRGRVQLFFRLWPILLVLFTASVTAIDFDYQGLSGETKDNVKVYLEAQTFPENSSVRRISSASAEQTKRALRALGYYQSKIDVSEKEKDVYLVEVELGERLVISKFDFTFEGEANKDSRFTSAVTKSGLADGQVFSHAAYDGLKSEFNRLAARYGYFDAEYHQSEVKISIKENTASIYLSYDSGHRYRFGDIIFTNPDLPKTIFANLAEFNKQDRYDSKKVGEFNQRLGETDYFQVISVRPDLENRHDDKIDLLVGLALKPRDTFEVGGGITTDIGPRVRLKWTRPWVNDKGHSIAFEIEAAEPKQSALFVYRIPMNNPVDDYLDIQTGYIREKTNDTESEKTVVSTTRQWRWDNDWKPSIFLKWQHEEYRQADQFDVTDLVLPGFNFARLRTRGGLDPYWGDNLQASVEVGHPYWGSDVEMLRLATIGKWLRSYQNHRLLLRADVGGILAEDITDVPASMRFFAGGDQSIRGYDYKTISPKNEEGQLIGGKYLTVGSIEYNYQFAEKWRWATFVDAGTATNDFSEPVSVGVGMGIRWLTLIGPLRIDVAKGLQNESDPWRVHFSLGPDL
ncbi:MULTISPECIES: autotransporter assembly complex protein TamA [unclassified Agarivorans]|uniref:autotransporter assembly complex protein TamA n=1 Tax=unclassified Agarivorans TaxID=2636026 RepID=UPI0026E45C12|nr:MULTISPECIES: autotransporter assembly complex family protein [unclassified Agarivorans]MDO6687788.1 autotransporter assembly complex family protein [Agarivorans sp. 3_MG-2023]MDO6717348.1 autotransporter assembly complex family protein [Agarivorans sp. 2_MG-2023]